MKEHPKAPTARRQRPPGRTALCPLAGALEQSILAMGQASVTQWPRTGHRPSPSANVQLRELYDRLLWLAFGLAVRAAADARGLANTDTPSSASDVPTILNRSGVKPQSEAADKSRPVVQAAPPDVMTLMEGVFAATDPTFESPERFNVCDLGAAYEYLLELSPAIDSDGRFTLVRRPGHARKTTGSYYTPPALVGHILDHALQPAIDEAWSRGGADAVLSLRVCDPSCGSGNFLVPAAQRIAARLVAGGAHDATAAAFAASACIYGMDKSPLAADLCRSSLWLELSGPGRPSPVANIAAGDALTADWPALFPEVFARGGFDAVVGNPPFLNQLGSATATKRSDVAALKAVFPGAVHPYTDPAALFLILGTRIAREGGRVAMVQPQSVLSARDARPARNEVLARGTPESLWVAGERVFDAMVLVCVPSIRIGGPRRGTLSRSVGADFRPVADVPLDGDDLLAAESWAHLAAAAMGIPELTLRRSGTLADLANATADFRDQFYGLRGFIVEDEELSGQDRGAFPKLITTGLIDPATCLWGRAPTRFDGRQWRAPRVDLRRLEAAGELGPWARSRLVPKILLATQTRVLEAAVDENGSWLPAVPLITIVPKDSASIWRIAAALLSPPLSVWAAQRHGVGGLSAGAIKLSAKQALGLPMPAAGRHWDDAAARVREAAAAPTTHDRSRLLTQAAGLMAESYGLAATDAAAVLAWWQGKSRSRKSAAGL